MKFVSDTFQEDIATLEAREYNGFNELVAVCRDGVRIAYRYRPDGLRYGKTIQERDRESASTVHLWDGQNIVDKVLLKNIKSDFALNNLCYSMWGLI